ncbi:MAG: type 4a pilus biogenesis protein PilO [Planctomycetes bacterium]|nr:type 4a pilus biogenesis protein PilO [Planctomycetota bacterium]
MGRFTEKQLTIITIVVAVLITGLFTGLVMKDLSAIGEERSRVETIVGQIAAADAEIQKMDARELDVIVLREIVKRDAAILPDESEINEFINVIGEFERAAGVLVTQVQGLGKKELSKGKEAIQKIPLKLRLQGTTEQILKFLNLFENHDRFVSISGFAVSRGSDVDSKGNLQHTATVELETYSYNPKGGPVARVEIPNAERRAQELVVQQRVSQSKAAAIEKYQLRATLNRRDPILDPRIRVTAPDDTVDPEERFRRERGLLDELILEIQLLRLDVQAEAKFRAEHDIIKIPAAAKAVEEKLNELEVKISGALSNQQITIAELKEQFVQSVVRPFEEIKSGRNAFAAEVVVRARQVQEWYVKMRERFEAAAYRDVMTAWDGYQRLVDGRQVAPDAQALQDQMKELARQAEVISRFEREPMKIQGVIIDPSSRSFAIINGSILSEGEDVDRDGKIRIEKIRNDQIQFIYQGVPIVKFLRK